MPVITAVSPLTGYGTPVATVQVIFFFYNNIKLNKKKKVIDQNVYF